MVVQTLKSQRWGISVSTRKLYPGIGWGILKSQTAKLLQSIITGLLIAGALWSLYRLWVSPGVGTGFVAAAVLGSLLTWRSLHKPPPPADSGDLSSEKRLDPKQYQTSLRLAFTWNDGQSGSFSDLSIQPEQFIAWCVGAAAGRSLGENHWTGSAGIFTKADYHSFRDELLARGFIRHRGKHPTSGVELTSKGSAMTGEVSRRHHAQSPSRNHLPIPALPGPVFSSPLGGYANEREGER